MYSVSGTPHLSGCSEPSPSAVFCVTDGMKHVEFDGALKCSFSKGNLRRFTPDFRLDEKMAVTGQHINASQIHVR